MRRPLSSTSRTIGEFDKCDWSGLTCRKPLTEKELQANSHYSTPSAVGQAAAHAARALHVDRHAKIATQDKSFKPERYRDHALDLAELDRPTLEAALAERGHERFRARQIFGWIYRRGVTDLDAMTDLSRELRATLASDFTLDDARTSSRASVRPTAPRSFCCASPTAGRSSRSSSPTRRR